MRWGASASPDQGGWPPGLRREGVQRHGRRCRRWLLAWSAERCVTTGERGVSVGEPDVTVGERDVTVGERDVTVGERDVTVGERDVTVGEPSVTVGGRWGGRAPAEATPPARTASTST